MSAKPTVVFVPGAWHNSEGFEAVAALLKAAGYGYKGLHLPSVTSNGPFIQSNEDAVFVLQAVTELVEAGEDVVIVMHSYGGIPGSSGAKGLSKEDRAKEGKQGGVIAMVYMTALAVEEGVSMYDAASGNFAPWIKVHKETTYMSIDGDPNDIFYGDLSVAEASKWTAKLFKQAYKSFRDPATYTAWRFIPSTYIVCGADKAISVPVQEALAAQEGKFKIERLDGASHSPFLSRPGETAGIIRRAAGEDV